MKIKEFKARIKKIQYKEFESNSSYSKEPIIYSAQCLICENHQGNQKFEIRHNCTFYMSKEDYENKILEVGDIVKIFDNVNFLPTLINFNLYDEEKLKEIPANKIETDKNGRSYCPSKAFAYKLVAKIGQWEIDRKNTEMFYWQVGRLKIFMENESEMLEETAYAFHLEEKEFNKLKECAGQVVVMNGYKYNSIIKKQPARITIEPVEKINKWKCLIEKLEESENE